MTSEEYRAAVVAVARSIPRGSVMSYGAIADYLAEASGRRSSRLVGQVLARTTDVLPWHRVVRHDGSPARGHEAAALRLLRDEGAPLRGPRVEMRVAEWRPPTPPERFLAGTLQPRRLVTPL